MSNPALRKVALVTGASRGIGRAIAVALAPSHELILTARDEHALGETREACLEAGGHTATLVACDMTDTAARQALADTILKDDVAVLVNNAGIAPSAPAERTTTDAWDDVMTVNVTAPFELIRAAIPSMKRAGWGRIINIASTAALRGYRYTAAYCASKHAVLGLTRGVALDVARTGITVNAVCPGFTDTDMASRAVDNIAGKTGRDPAQARAALERMNPQGRLVDPAEVAAMVQYLCTPAADGINGQALAIDGGETA